MCPEKAKIFIAEDDEGWQRSLKWMLEDKGHQVVLTAKTRDEALEAIRRIPELGIQVATIDGNLNDWDTSGDDGQAVLKAIKAIAPEVKTIGMAGGNVRGVDVNVSKFHVEQLADIVTKL